MYLSETYEKKWQPVLEHADLPKITDSYKRAVTATILENQERASKEDSAFLSEAAPVSNTAGVSNWDPILISLVRRAMPNLIAYDIAGVQPMTGPVGLIFAMRSRYTNQSGTEAMFDEADIRILRKKRCWYCQLLVQTAAGHTGQILLYLMTLLLELTKLVKVWRLLLLKH